VAPFDRSSLTALAPRLGEESDCGAVAGKSLSVAHRAGQSRPRIVSGSWWTPPWQEKAVRASDRRPVAHRAIEKTGRLAKREGVSCASYLRLGPRARASWSGASTQPHQSQRAPGANSNPGRHPARPQSSGTSAAQMNGNACSEIARPHCRSASVCAQQEQRQRGPRSIAARPRGGGTSAKARPARLRVRLQRLDRHIGTAPQGRPVRAAAKALLHGQPYDAIRSSVIADLEKPQVLRCVVSRRQGRRANTYPGPVQGLDLRSGRRVTKVPFDERCAAVAAVGP